jgi:hypothetical protein
LVPKHGTSMVFIETSGRPRRHEHAKASKRNNLLHPSLMMVVRFILPPEISLQIITSFPAKYAKMLNRDQRYMTIPL